LSANKPLWSLLIALVLAAGSAAGDSDQTLDFSLPTLDRDAQIQLAQYHNKIVYLDV